MERRSISAGFVEDLLRCARAAGIDTADLLARVGLADWRAGSGPDGAAPRLSHEDYGRLWLELAALMQDEYFGLGARPMRPGSFTMMGHAVLDAANLGQGLRRMLRFLRLVLDEPWGELRHVGAHEVEIILHDRRGARPAFADRTYWLVLMGMCCWLIGRRIPLRRVAFCGEVPQNRADYLHFFGAPVQFGAGQSLLAFDARYLGLPNIRDLAQLRSFLRGAPANILVRYRHDQGLSGRVRARLRATPAEQWPAMPVIAADLGLSLATLRRHLRAEGQSFAAIRDEILRLRAEQFLCGSAMTIAQIAAQLGYSEPGAFQRAFRKWTGRSPGGFRRAHQLASAS